MTPEKLAELIAAGESLDVEFKGERVSSLSDRALIEAVVCLANRPGAEPGWLLVGVEDDGQVTGARPRHEGGTTDSRRGQAVIANRTRPALTCRAELIQVRGVEVLVIEVPASRQPVGTTDGLYLRRALGGRGAQYVGALPHRDIPGGPPSGQTRAAGAADSKRKSPGNVVRRNRRPLALITRS